MQLPGLRKRWNEWFSALPTETTKRYMEAMTVSAIIVAAGRGARLGGDVPKQYQMLSGAPVLKHTILSLLASDRVTEVIVVINPRDAALYEPIADSIPDDRLKPAVLGGDSRSVSVGNGLKAAGGDYVAIHDGARPLVPLDALERVFDQARKTGAAFLAMPVTDAVWQVTDGRATTALPRDAIWRAQTPQVFERQAILAAHTAHDGPADDDVAIAVAAGLDVHPVRGSQRNLKITFSEDLVLAEQQLGTDMDIRTGNGFDVHKFGPGDHVVLCGLKIPHDHGLVGHSDADVAMHAVTDALFGAIAEGDIGQWFPPSDPQWKGAASEIFLRKAVERVTERGFRINNIDCTLICETPKIGPHSTQMRHNLAAITGLGVEYISVKATTSEKLGFTGRREGIAAQATVLVSTT
jgi:2-C-methyl-D-erythritol 4-phosphate cytidylyltransferase/2-C-methyl-D-erythritol 2,4-cyclodiphosphate synthase